MKKILIFILAITMLNLTVLPAFAQTSAGNSTASANKSARITQNQNQKMENLKTRANNEIDRRITSLNGLITRIGALKKISQEQKNLYITQVQAEVTNLTSLKAKINTDTDLVTLKTDVQSIVKSYRVYLLFMPKIRLLAASDTLNITADNLSTLSAKLQVRITEEKTKGKDVTSLEASLSDMQTKILDARTQSQAIIVIITPLTPDGYPANKTELEKARTMLKTGHNDLIKARQDAKNIIQGLKGNAIKPSPNITGTTSATNSSI